MQVAKKSDQKIHGDVRMSKVLKRPICKFLEGPVRVEVFNNSIWKMVACHDLHQNAIALG